MWPRHQGWWVVGRWNLSIALSTSTSLKEDGGYTLRERNQVLKSAAFGPWQG